MSNTVTSWYICVVNDEDANQSIGQHLGEDVDTSMYEKLECKALNGVMEKRNMWQVEYSVISNFVKLKKKRNYDFRVFRKRGGGMVEEIPLHICGRQEPGDVPFCKQEKIPFPEAEKPDFM